jgi:hypothetical protein
MSRKRMLGSVDLLGLNQMGNNPGLNPIFGTLIGGGVSGITSMVIGHTMHGSAQVNRDVIGLGAGLAASAALYAMPATRHAAIGAVVGAFLASGLSWFERVLFGTVQLPAATAAVASAVASGAAPTAAGTNGMRGLGIATTRALNGLGMSTTRALNGAGMGIATTQQRTTPVGTIPGVAGLRLGNGQAPLNLLGNRSAASEQVRLMGGPAIHGIAGHYGATHFNH